MPWHLFSKFRPIFWPRRLSVISRERCEQRSIRSYSTKLNRKNKYKTANADDIAFFRSILGESGVLTSCNGENLDKFNHDWLGRYKGNSSIILRPKNTSEVSMALSYCNKNKLAVVPQGGNTGLVGGSVPVQDEIVISLSRMNRILSFEKYQGIIHCEAGCVLENIETYLDQRGFTIPLDLGSKGSCMIGGNLSTNAGGLRLLRYGSLHDSCLGLEVVLPDGSILSDLHGLRKDNTGPDIKQLFIGHEGLFGIITAASLLAPIKSTCKNLLFLGHNTFDEVLSTFSDAKVHLSEILSAVEFMDRRTLEISFKHGASEGVIDPLSDSEYPFYVMIETSGSNNAHDSEKLNAFLEKSMLKGHVSNGVIAQDATQMQRLWYMRESFAVYLKQHGHLYTYDVSLPLTKFYDLVYHVENELKNCTDIDVDVSAFGHLGDGNLHLNICTPNFEARIEDKLQDIVYPWVHEHNGSISAEHGLGQMKRDKIHFTKSKDMIEWMKRLKLLFDPNGILQPNKVLPY